MQKGLIITKKEYLINELDQMALKTMCGGLV
jgi:hypothetical protein